MIEKSERLYAWKFLVTFHDDSKREAVRTARTETQARRRVLLLPLAFSAEVIETFTEAEYRRCYGTRSVRGS